jgi:cytochrome P450
MRMHPSAGFTMPRPVPDGGDYIAGHFIPAGYCVGTNAAVVQYDTDVFGKDAAEFNPSRWIERDAAMMDRYMIHFGVGLRTCIGKP